MSTAQSSAPEKSTAMYATLVRGRVYYLKNREFLNGVSELVTPEEHAWLEENAFDLVSVEGEGEHQVRPKFKFSGSPVAEKASGAPPRSRARTQ